MHRSPFWQRVLRRVWKFCLQQELVLGWIPLVFALQTWRNRRMILFHDLWVSAQACAKHSERNEVTCWFWSWNEIGLCESWKRRWLWQVRHRLRREHDIHGGIPVVFSLEKPKVKLLPFKGPNGEDAQPSDYQVRLPLLRGVTSWLWWGPGYCCKWWFGGFWYLFSPMFVLVLFGFTLSLSTCPGLSIVVFRFYWTRQWGMWM